MLEYYMESYKVAWLGGMDTKLFTAASRSLPTVDCDFKMDDLSLGKDPGGLKFLCAKGGYFLQRIFHHLYIFHTHMATSNHSTASEM
jgi:hypothetical protein